MNLFYLLSRTSPNIINKEELSNVLGIDLNTLKTYMNALRGTFLISEADFYTTTTYRSLRKDKKIYITDIGLRNLYANSFDEQIFTHPDKMGNLVEIVVATHSNRLIFNLEGIKSNRIYYWRESDQGFEVDIVLSLISKALPIEVKYKGNILSSDFNGLKSFARRFRSVHADISLLITKDEIGLEGPAIKIPTWLYLIMC
jgi:predicted AAA+ superfamily ATPase